MILMSWSRMSSAAARGAELSPSLRWKCLLFILKVVESSRFCAGVSKPSAHAGLDMNFKFFLLSCPWLFYCSCWLIILGHAPWCCREGMGNSSSCSSYCCLLSNKQSIACFDTRSWTVAFQIEYWYFPQHLQQNINKMVIINPNMQ